MMESTVRNNEYAQSADADPRAYWADAARQGGRGVATLAQVAGIPGSAAQTALEMGIPPQLLRTLIPGFQAMENMPTWGGIGRRLDTTFGEGTTPASSGFRQAGEASTGLVGLGQTGRLAQAARFMERLKRGAGNVGDATNLYTAFPQ